MTRNLHMRQLYQKLKKVSISDAICAFKELEVKEPADGDRYFERFGVGNIIERVSRAYERFACYEFLLQEIKNVDRGKYDDIHKGTAYYFLAWTAFDIGDYEKATFYLDMAFGEDVSKSKQLGSSDGISSALEEPGGFFMRLVPEQSGPAARVVRKLKKIVEERIGAFNKKHVKRITVEEFVQDFVTVLVRDDAYRSLVTAIHSFIYEFEDRYRMLKLASGQEGSFEPWILHLFKGGLILESMFKYVGEKFGYSTIKYGKKIQANEFTFGDFLREEEFTNRYERFEIREKELDELIKLPQGSIRNSFGVTHKLRNKAGHNLKHKRLLAPKDYRHLFEQELAAIFYIVEKEFIKEVKNEGKG